jgi:hypothetical protein
MELEIFSKPCLGTLSKQPSILEEHEYQETERITENLMDLKRRLELPAPVNIQNPSKLEEILKRMEQACIDAGSPPKRQDSQLNTSQTPDIIPQSETGHFLGVPVPPVTNEGPKEASSSYWLTKFSECVRQSHTKMVPERRDPPGKRYLDGTKVHRVQREKTVRFSEDVPESKCDTTLVDADSFSFLDELDLGHEKILGRAIEVLDAETDIYWESGKTVDFDKFMESDEVPNRSKEKIVNKNITSQSKNLNKCFIKDINESLLGVLDKSFIEDETLWPLSSTWNGESELLTSILSYVEESDANLLMNLEEITNRFQMSLVQIINSLMRDDAFILKDSGNSTISKLKIETWPSIEFFNQTYLSDPHQQFDVDSIDLAAIDPNVTMQLNLRRTDKRTNSVDYMQIDVMFAAKYLNDARYSDESVKEKETFSIFITSFFEVFIDFIFSCSNIEIVMEMGLFLREGGDGKKVNYCWIVQLL